jgi:peptide/nickel transport system permease protein
LTVQNEAQIVAEERVHVSGWTRFVAGNKIAAIGAATIATMLLIAIMAPVLNTIDPVAINPAFRYKPPGTTIANVLDNGHEVERVALMGTDSLGRDIYSRVIYGTRISLLVGGSVALISGMIGLFIGLIAGYVRWAEGPIMRAVDALMAIPNILLAIGLVSVWGAGLVTLIFAIVITEVPRVVRMVRSTVLTVRAEPYVEAAISVGTRVPLILWRHILPSTIAPLVVQGTFICATAIMIEAALSFLGIGLPADTPTWGNIMADGRALFRINPHTIMFPGAFLAATVLAVNMLGDGLRDFLDPRVSKGI